MKGEPRCVPGSYRDPDGRVFRLGPRVLRALSPEGKEEIEALLSTSFYPSLVAKGKCVGTRWVEESDVPLTSLEGDWSAVVEHDVLPFVAFPFEWCFSMLQDAALLQLDLLEGALEEDFTLKDATPYNIVFRGASPVFIDILSFERRRPEPWIGYLQFCQTFLYPLFLTAYRDLPFHPWLRGVLDGIQPEEAANIFCRARDLLRPGVLRDVRLMARLQAATASSDTSVRDELRREGFPKELITANVRRLRKIVGRLTWQRKGSEWADYAGSTSYDDSAHDVKATFVRDAAEKLARSGTVVDFGANTGVFSRIAAEGAEHVLALDADHLAVERLYRSLRDEGHSKITPLVVDLVNPTPGLGWANSERPTLHSRLAPDLSLALALVHHLAIGRNIPLREVVDWFASLGGHLVFEWVGREDPMVRRLLLNKEDRFRDYRREVLEEELRRHYVIDAEVEVPGLDRRLYRLVRG